MKNLFITLFLAFMFIIRVDAQSLTFTDAKEVAGMLTEMCPIMIDKDTRFDRCDALTDEFGTIIMQFGYTLVNTLNSDYSYEQISTIKRVQESKLAKSLRTNETMRVIRENNITVSYIYYDKNHIIFMIIKITPEKYNDPNLAI